MAHRFTWLREERREGGGRGSVISRLFHTENYTGPFIGVCSELLSSGKVRSVPACQLMGKGPLMFAIKKKPSPCEVGLRLALIKNSE